MNQGELIIDGEDRVDGLSLGNTKSIHIHAPYSFGGVNPSLLNITKEKAKIDISKVFQGCIRNIQISGRDLGRPPKIIGALPCSDQIEEGVYFNGGFLKVKY